MLCQNCQKHEATFHYQENINGQKSEWHLCSSCAQEHESIFMQNRHAMLHMFHDAFPFGLMDSPISLKERMPLTVTKDDVSEKKDVCSKKMNNVQKNPLEMSVEELQVAMQTAVMEEDYEKAAKIRDIMKNKNQAE